LKVTISNDIESAAPITAAETMQQYTVGAGVLWYVPVRGGRRRIAPFATAGGGYLRQLHQGGTLLERGQYYQAGGGLKYLILSRADGRLNAIGARIDVRALVRVKGVASDNRGHTAPSVGAAVFVRF
jgi:hypothetical protein